MKRLTYCFSSINNIRTLSSKQLTRILKGGVVILIPQQILIINLHVQGDVYQLEA